MVKALSREGWGVSPGKVKQVRRENRKNKWRIIVCGGNYIVVDMKY